MLLGAQAALTCWGWQLPGFVPSLGGCCARWVPAVGSRQSPWLRTGIPFSHVGGNHLGLAPGSSAWLSPEPRVCAKGEVTIHHGAGSQPGAGMGAWLNSPQADVRIVGEGPAVKAERAAAGKGLAWKERVRLCACCRRLAPCCSAGGEIPSF